jgi:isopentenyldiphosphate isomerase
VKNNTKNSHEPVDKQHYKKKYLLRVIEHGEAEEEIRIAKRKQLTNDPSEVSEMQWVDETKIYKQ